MGIYSGLFVCGGRGWFRIKVLFKCPVILLLKGECLLDGHIPAETQFGGQLGRAFGRLDQIGEHFTTQEQERFDIDIIGSDGEFNKTAPIQGGGKFQLPRGEIVRPPVVLVQWIQFGRGVD